MEPQAHTQRPTRPPRSRLWLAVGIAVAVLLIAGIAIALSLPKGKATKVTWPASYGGRPAGLGVVNQPASKVAVTASPGIYVWSDFDGWHLLRAGTRFPVVAISGVRHHSLTVAAR